MFKKQVINKSLEDKSFNLGNILKEKNISVDGVNGNHILEVVENIRSMKDEVEKKNHEILSLKEKLRAERQKLQNSYISLKAYLLAKAKNDPELMNLVPTIKFDIKRSKRKSDIDSNITNSSTTAE